MMRVLVEEVLLFLLPFALFAFYLLIRRRNPFHFEHWSNGTSWLVIAGLALAIASLVWAGFTSERRKEGFQPTHMENGRLVPGQFR